uniref:Fibronectin type-III domain-containing protein n=1 Tax=Plectus sambesii TaxID=2011161 RepID=A0A914WIS4_9BILA
VPAPSVRELRARFEQDTQSIFIEWNYERPDDVEFVVRHRVRGSDSWSMERTTGRSVRVPLSNMQDGDELEVQVKVERNGQTIEDWSQQLIITLRKRTTIDGVPIAMGEDELMPPLDFTAHVLSPTSVRLEWRTNGNEQTGLYYIVIVEQLTSESGGQLLRQQIKIEANNFALGSLIPGEKYAMTIKSALSPDRVSSSAAVVEITMPKEDEYFEVGNLIINSHFASNGEGTVNLTWEVPSNMEHKILSYDVQYQEKGVEPWMRVQFSGNRPSATLRHLKSNTEYLLKIRTQMRDGLTTESGQFKFLTPPANPISKIDVIYSREVNTLRLQWILEPFVDSEPIVGYDVYLSENKDQPEQQWRHILLDSREASLSLNDLKSGTTYYVKVNVRNRDGTELKGRSVYRFRTMDQSTNNVGEAREPNSLAYRNIGNGQVTLSWSYPHSISGQVAGATIMYTDDKTKPMNQWMKVLVTEPSQSSVVLSHLLPGQRYFVQILPKLTSGRYDESAMDMFELKTDERDQQQALPSTDNLNRANEQTRRQEDQPVHDDSREQLCLLACDPRQSGGDQRNPSCSQEDQCIPALNNPSSGWCVPDTLRQAITSV